jgi:hypothetical protein
MGSAEDDTGRQQGLMSFIDQSYVSHTSLFQVHIIDIRAKEMGNLWTGVLALPLTVGIHALLLADPLSMSCAARHILPL